MWFSLFPTWHFLYARKGNVQHCLFIVSVTHSHLYQGQKGRCKSNWMSIISQVLCLTSVYKFYVFCIYTDNKVQLNTDTFTPLRFRATYSICHLEQSGSFPGVFHNGSEEWWWFTPWLVYLQRLWWGHCGSTGLWIIFQVTTRLHIKYSRLPISGLYKSTFTSTQQQSSSVATRKFVVMKNQKELTEK